MARLGGYSKRWFDAFGSAVEALQTEHEVNFIMRQIGTARKGVAGQRILDVCCGAGRHANRLAENGYDVIGVDLDAHAIALAREAAVNNAAYLQADMRELREALSGQSESFEAIICMWQSFGQFSDQENQQVLLDFATLLRTGGVLLLDVYNPEFFQRHQGVRTLERSGRVVKETKEFGNGRVSVMLDYGDGEPDRFDWRLYSRDEWRNLGAMCNLRLEQSCTMFQEDMAPASEDPRVQLRFVRQ